MRVYVHRFFLLTLACMLCLGASAKKKEKGVYLFGYGTALLDSTVYLSAPVFLDSATIDPKTKIVHSIVRYSNQFQSYVEALYQPHVLNLLTFCIIGVIADFSLGICNHKLVIFYTDIIEETFPINSL